MEMSAKCQKADIGCLAGSAGPLPSSQPEKKAAGHPPQQSPTIGRNRGEPFLQSSASRTNTLPSAQEAGCATDHRRH